MRCVFPPLSIQTFIVRNSQKARYALSVRVPKDDPAVSHFLIESNQQGEKRERKRGEGKGGGGRGREEEGGKGQS